MTGDFPKLSQRLAVFLCSVKYFLSIVLRALRRARHYALVEDVALPYQPRLARNRFQVKNSVRPMHLFGHNLDHDYYFGLPGEINFSVF